MRILIADDQRSFGTTLAEMVRFCGHEVVGVVGSGLEAIQSYSLHKPDLVLMDHWMPRLNGVTASRHIIAKNPAARVVLLSAWSPLDGADESGAICFLPKPVDMERLSATLLTVSQTIPPPAFFPAAGENGHFAPNSISMQPTPTPEVPVFKPGPIPPEIISPIETFPIDIFPLESPAAETEFTETKVPLVAALSPAKQTKKKTRRSSGRKRRAGAA